jgi:hypothetical protein
MEAKLMRGWVVVEDIWVKIKVSKIELGTKRLRTPNGDS